MINFCVGGVMESYIYSKNFLFFFSTIFISKEDNMQRIYAQCKNYNGNRTRKLI
jgi:hypothetical protein